jgi:oxygen-independent coproporphyrinogen-3 oxidase
VERETAVDTSVYVHFPWCLKKCPYCDFATRPIARTAVPHEAYADAVVCELELRASTGALEGRRLCSVFFGGGTPSLWEPSVLGRVLREVRAAFSSETPDLEVTVECNPSSLDRARAAALRAQGVGRLSVGVQSLDDARLRFLGRLHDGDAALAALRGALAEVPRVSADLIFGVPGQGAEDFVEEVRRLLDLGLRHLSAYSLTVEPGTQFGALARRGKLPLAREEDVAESFLRGREALTSAGLAHYEVSNYAVPGEEARHNVHYWRGGDHVGLGAAAVGALSDPEGHALRWRNEPDAERYMAAVRDARASVAKGAAATLARIAPETEALSPEDRIREALMLGLRTREGVDLARLRARTGLDPLAGRERAIERRRARGDVVLEGDVLRVPPQRWLLLDGIVADLF